MSLFFCCYCMVIQACASSIVIVWYWLEFVQITGTVVSYPAVWICLKSTFINLSPWLTCWFNCTNTSKGFPSSSTVSIPTWIRISSPVSAFKPIACLVSANTTMLPLHGAYMISSSGRTAKPFPSYRLRMFHLLLDQGRWFYLLMVFWLWTLSHCFVCLFSYQGRMLKQQQLWMLKWYKRTWVIDL